LIGKKNNYALGNISKENAIQLVRKRIGNLEFLPDNMIIKIFNKNKNPRAFLKNCEAVCREAFEDTVDKVTDKHLTAAKN
jgi:hypothetical protein